VEEMPSTFVPLVWLPIRATENEGTGWKCSHFL